MGAQKLEQIDADLQGAWEHVLANKYDPFFHERFLEICTARNRLSFAADCYKELLANDPRHPIALAYRQKLIGRMVAIGLTLVESASPQPVTGGDVRRIGLALVGLLSVLLTFSIEAYLVGVLLFAGSLAWTVWTYDRRFTPGPLTDSVKLVRQKIGVYITMADFFYSAFFIVDALKRGRLSQLSFAICIFVVFVFTILTAMSIWGQDSVLFSRHSGLFRKRRE
ncbi:MAG TPA: hypothetical protein VFV50_14970 [Bdellovibrionales bacterium]|nr:hypothetical protein [Bdellovibrionales bacterium]